MTVTYSAEVATSRGFGCFWKLLFRWRGSIYKLLWPDLSLYFLFYYFLSILYRFILSESQRRYFEKVSLYCKAYGDLIPVSFILGFYVSIVVKRWWDSFNCIPWPDTLAFFVSAYIHGQDERGRLMRRTMMRYANLAFVITLSCISPCVKKRFPTMDHLVDAGILLPNEKKIMEQLKTSHTTYWMPLVWASSIAIRARKEGRVRDDFALNTLVEAMANYRALCGGLFNYDWISIPLVYTQVVTLVVYTFFLSTLMGRQYLDPAQGHPGYDVDLYIPVFNFLQFFFYMGWLKVAETLVNPFGEDDDDFEVNWVIDRDIQVSYLIVDEMHQEHPELIKDQYWDETLPDLPYTAAAMPFYSEPPMGSAANLVIPPHEAEFVPLETLDEDELEDIKINAIPYEKGDMRNRLTHNLSGSVCSGISRLGQSFQPASYEKRGGFLNMMTDLLSRESSVRKKLRKAPSKDSTIGPSPSCNTSGPPTPDEFKDHSGLSDDIFHLSDLSLADSRCAQSPSYYTTKEAADFFWSKKPDRYFRNLRRSQLSISKGGSTPKSELADEERLRTPRVIRKKSSNSLKNFFKAAKYRGSQKSLIDNMKHDPLGSRRTLRTQQSEISDADSITENFDDNENNDKNSVNSDEEITIMEVHDKTKSISKSNNYIDNPASPQTSSPITISKKPRSSLPQVHSSPEKNLFSKFTKQPSTATLVPSDGSNEGTPLAHSNKIISSLKNQPLEETEKMNTNDIHINSPDNNTMDVNMQNCPMSAKPNLMNSPQKKLFSRRHPNRASSLYLSSQRKGSDAESLSGIQKFFGRHRGSRRHSHTMSQPVSPTEAPSPDAGRKVFFPRGLFSRRNSRGAKDVGKSSHSLQAQEKHENTVSPSFEDVENAKNFDSKFSEV